MKSFLAIVFSTLVTLGIAEAGLRLIYPDGISPAQANNTWPWIESGPVVSWQNQPGFQHKSMGIAINSHNFRGPEVRQEPAPGVLRIVCLGDSRTFGIWSYEEQIKADNAYPTYLQELFDASRRDVEVINAGVIGYASSHGLRQLVTKVVDLQPDVIVVSFGINDSAASWNPSLRDIEPQSPLARGILYGLGDFRVFQLMRTAYFSVPGSSPDAWTVRWNTPGQYRNHMRRIAEVGAASGAHVLFLNQALRDISRGASIVPPGSKKTPVPTMLGFDDLEHLHRAYGVYQAIMLELAQEEGIALVDGAADFAAHQGEPLFGDYDLVHVNVQGARRHAKLVYDEIIDLGWVD